MVKTPIKINLDKRGRGWKKLEDIVLRKGDILEVKRYVNFKKRFVDVRELVLKASKKNNQIRIETVCQLYDGLYPEKIQLGLYLRGGGPRGYFWLEEYYPPHSENYKEYEQLLKKTGVIEEWR